MKWLAIIEDGRTMEPSFTVLEADHYEEAEEAAEEWGGGYPVRFIIEGSKWLAASLERAAQQLRAPAAGGMVSYRDADAFARQVTEAMESDA